MEEDQVIQGCKKNERKAQKLFVDNYSAYIYTICRRYVIEEFAAQDCLQNSLVQVLMNISKYKESGSFKAWVSKVTVRKCLEYLRKNKKHNHSELESFDDPVECNGILVKMELDEVMKFLKTLPYNYRMALNMFLVEGYSHKEIAEILDVSESSSRSLVTRGRKMIKDKFDSDQMSVIHNRLSKDGYKDGENLMVR